MVKQTVSQLNRQAQGAVRKFFGFSASVGGAAALLGIAYFASRLLALVRDRVLATGFGAGAQLDVYFAAFRIPDFIFNVLIFGAISSAFIPVFAGYLVNNKKETADQVGSVVLTAGTMLLVAVAALAFVFAPQIAPLIAPGFSAAQLTEVTELTRIMLLSPIFFGIGGIFGSVLHSHQRFVAYAVAPLLYNLGIIAGAVVAPELGLKYLAWGVAAGAFLQMSIQLIAGLRTGFRFRPNFNLRLPGVRRIFWLMIPTTIGAAILQINFLVETIIASLLQAGSLAQFWLATSLSMVPVSVVGAAFATAVFPVLAKAASTQQTSLYVENLVTVIRKILFVVIPASIAIMLLRAQIVRLIYGAGNFDFEDTRYVTSILGILAVSLFAQSLIPLLSKAFYAIRNTRTPVAIAGVAMLVNVAIAVPASYYLGVIGLALAFSFASIIQLALLFFFLSGKVPAIEDRSMLSAITRITFASLAAGAAIYGTLYGVAYLIEDIQSTQTVAFFTIQTVLASLVGAGVYLMLTTAMKLPEARLLLVRARHPLNTED
ncbi:MAG: murein biosynthesis integral membrane protein MurJ [bacterium]|nr:murein biosynthesis integral membrane protein MurJ [bacterium]MDZ4248065.1 murein biosynthesis integral membrane protein MurJ [Patescibacteria group bacterium]